MIRQNMNRFLLVAAAAALALGGAQPAFAKGKGGHHGGRHGGHHASGHGGHNGHHSSRRHGGHGRHHGGHGNRHHSGSSYYGGGYGYGYSHHGHGGDAALIALGVVGGLILIDSAIDGSRRDSYNSSYGNSSYGNQGYGSPRPSSEYYYRQSSPAAENSDDIELALEGGDAPYSADYPSEQRAFNACTKRARASLKDRGLMVATPAVPNSARQTGDGVWRFEADFTTQDRDGGQWLRVMTCEANNDGIRLLELI